MANARNTGRKGDAGRDPGAFMALPCAVMDCPAYRRLSYAARSLLMDIFRQFVKDNNGRLLASRAYLAGRGWNSADVINRAKRELLEAGFIHETVKGHRPNKASWYAVTWRILDPHHGYDPGAAATFVRGAYRGASLPEPLKKNAVLSPAGGTGQVAIGPSPGTGRGAAVPSPGPIEPVSAALSVPSAGHLLEMPSEGERAGGEGHDGALDHDPADECSREREGEIDVSRFDAVTGEFLPPREIPAKPLKKAAAAWVEASLAQRGAGRRAA
ncbi:hypothetical protein WDZ92_31280 [Nostoc sp. NIES-2111]